MADLFTQDPVFKGKKRDSKGRFATAERAMYDKAIREHNYLLFQIEKYRRQTEVHDGAFIALQRTNAELLQIIANLRRELAELKKSSKKC